MVCGKALETLVAVAITGKVDVSTFVGNKNLTINAGDRCVSPLPPRGRIGPFFSSQAK
jgi:hypothetical protein